MGAYIPLPKSGTRQPDLFSRRERLNRGSLNRGMGWCSSSRKEATLHVHSGEQALPHVGDIDYENESLVGGC